MKDFKIHFKNWTLNAWISEQDGEKWVAVKPIAEAIGLQHRRQISKLQHDPKFSGTLMCTTGADGKSYQMFCLPLRQINGWLYGINANLVGETL